MKPLLKELRTFFSHRPSAHLAVHLMCMQLDTELPLQWRFVVLASDVADDWIADTRSKAITLLCTALVYLEEHITQDVSTTAKPASISVMTTGLPFPVCRFVCRDAVRCFLGGLTVIVRRSLMAQIDEIVVTLMRMIHTDDMMVVAARLVGRFVEPDAYMPYLLPLITGALC